LDRLHIRVHLWWVSRWARRLLVVTGARCPLAKPVVTAVELQATTEPHCSRGVQPGGIYVCVGTARADSRGSGAGPAPRPQAPPIPAAARILYMHIHKARKPLFSPLTQSSILFLVHLSPGTEGGRPYQHILDYAEQTRRCLSVVHLEETKLT
jgi:hypothetical protein